MSKYTDKDFIKKANEKHNRKYDYSQVSYVDSQTKVAIICHEKDILGNEHGVFFQRPYSHLQGFGCPKCNGRNKTTEIWVEEAKNVYPEGKYTFEKTIYTHARDKLIVTCTEHGDFTTIARDFLSGHGCPKCNMPKLERIVETALQNKNISYEFQKKIDWLEGLILDFFIPDEKIAIECQGIEHFIKKDFFDKRETLDARIKRDERKRQLCEKHGIKLLYFTEKKFIKYIDKKYESFYDEDELVKYINEYEID